jgi:Ribonuclease G/E
MEQQQKQIQIELSPEQSEGQYANGVGINLTPSEFILDFVRFLPGAQKAKVFARIIMTPQNASLLLNALRENIKKYEDRFGEIKIFGKEHKEIGFK